MASAIALALTGCRSKITGNEGNLEFSYVADDDVRNFNKPIAVGAKLNLKVAEAGTSRQVQLSSASSSADTVLKVESFQTDTMVLLGTGAGSATISVQAKVPDGSTKPDSVAMLSRVPEVLKIWHTCSSASTAKYLVNQDVWVPFDMEMKNGLAVIGYGYHPVSFNPAAGLTLNVTTLDQQFLRVKTATTRQTVKVSSTIDTSSIDMQLVEEGDIDAAAFSSTTQATTKVGAIGFHHVLASATGVPVCQAATQITAASTAASICDVTIAAAPDTATGPKNEYGWVKVTGKAAGTCTFDVNYPRARAGQGLTVPLQVTITAT